MSKRIFIDMDGTLCRFHDIEHKYIEQMWEPGFYLNLRPFEEFINAVSLCIDRNPDTEFFILSAVLDTEPPFAEAEKREWLHKFLPQITNGHMLFVPAGTDKAALIPDMGADCVLIDDYNKNLSEWRQSGGTAIKFINDVNDRGLGAYGGEKGNIWDGLRVRHDESAMATCLKMERFSGIDREENKDSAFYGFADDVLPERLLELLPDYFTIRQESDTALIAELYRNGEGFFDFASISDHSRTLAEKLTDKGKTRLSAFQTAQGVNAALMDCLDTCYSLSRAYSIPLSRLTGWITASVRYEHAWQTYPVTSSNLQVYIAKMLARDAQLKVLSDQIQAVSKELKQTESRIYMPSATDVAMDVVSNGLQKDTLSARCEALKSRLDVHKDEWRQLAGTAYPHLLFGNGQMKYQKYTTAPKEKPLANQK